MKEKDLAASLLPGQVMLERIQKLRDSELVAGEDYVKSGKGVFYSPAGVERLAEIVRLSGSAGTLHQSPQTATVQGTADDIGHVAAEGPQSTQTLPPAQELIEGMLEVLPKKTVRVVKVFATNPKFLHAQATDCDEAMLTVRVQNNKNFAPGMEMEVVKGIGGVWDYVGFLPRARGRW